MKKLVLIIPIMWISFVYFLSTKSSEQLQSIPIPKDNWAHIVAYFILGILLLFTLSKSNKLSFLNIILLTYSIGMTFGMIDEYIQSFTPQRNSDIGDLMRDSLGLLISISAYSLYVWIKKKHRE